MLSYNQPEDLQNITEGAIEESSTRRDDNQPPITQFFLLKNKQTIKKDVSVSINNIFNVGINDNLNQKSGICLFIRLLEHFNIEYDFQEEKKKGVSSYMNELFCVMLDKKVSESDNLIFPEANEHHKEISRLYIVDDLIHDIDFFYFDANEKTTIKDFIIRKKQVLSTSLYLLTKCNHIVKNLGESENKRKRLSKKNKNEKKKIEKLMLNIFKMNKDYEESKIVNVAKNVAKRCLSRLCLFAKKVVSCIKKSKSNEQQHSSEND